MGGIDDMAINMQDEKMGRFELAWKLVDAVLTMLVFEIVHIEIVTRQKPLTPQISREAKPHRLD